MGGYGPSPEPEFFLKKSGCDIVCMGEGEITISELMKSFENKTPLKDVPGIAWIENGKLQKTNRAPLVHDLDSLPWTPYEKFPIIRRYYPFWIEQYSFTLAVHAGEFSYSPLSLEMNFPTHVRFHKNCKIEDINPFLIHYHHRISKLGNVRNCYYENINKCLDKIKFFAKMFNTRGKMHW